MVEGLEDGLLTIDEMWNILRNHYNVSEETLRIVTDINGYSEETMEDILYAVAGTHNFDWEE